MLTQQQKQAFKEHNKIMRILQEQGFVSTPKKVIYPHEQLTSSNASKGICYGREYDFARCHYMDAEIAAI